MNKIIGTAVLILNVYLFGLNAQNTLKPMLGEDDKYGFIDSISGKWVIAPKYLTAGYFSKNGLAFVCKTKNKCGCIDINGKVKIPFRYIYDINYLGRLKQGWRDPRVVPVFNDSGLLVVNRLVKQKKHWYYGYGLIDSEGKEVLPLKYYFREETPNYYIVNGEEESNTDWVL
ncbi:MAG: WG repeat-containing protein [Bacteroidia bacterium]